jgi:pimeloyl-ACP methyl ester carboxylesterase
MGLYPPDAWTLEVPADDLAAARVELAVMQRHPAEGTAPPPPATAPIAGRSTTDYVTVAGAQILLRSVGDLSDGVPWLVIHHAPGSSALYDGLLLALDGPVLAMDLPGHGLSEPIAGLAQSVEGWAAAVKLTLEALGIGQVRVYGHNGGAAVAVELALAAPELVAGLALDAPVVLEAGERAAFVSRWLEGVEPLEPCWDGGHLLRAWHMRRDMELWWPWYDRRQACARTTEPRIDPADLTLMVREQMRQPENFAAAWRAVLVYPLRERLARTLPPCVLLAAEEDVFARGLMAAHAVRPDARMQRVEDSDGARAAALRLSLN